MQFVNLLALCLACAGFASALFCDLEMRSADTEYTFTDEEIKQWEQYKEEYGLTFTKEEEDYYMNELLCMWELAEELEANYTEQYGKDDADDVPYYHLNEWSFLSDADWSSMLLGFNVNSTNATTARQVGPVTPQWVKNAKENCNVPSFPGAQFEWYTRGKMTKIKNQQTCGSCYAQASISVLESMEAITTNQSPINMSVQSIVDCRVCGGCRGGMSIPVYQYVQRTGQIDTDDCYPSTHQEGYCRRTSQNCKVSVPIQEIYKLPPNRPDLIMKAIRNHGPVTTAIKAVEEFKALGKAIFSTDDPQCQNIVSPSQMDHQVTLIGYGTYKGIDFWIGRNSWGCSWGYYGYFIIERGVNMCGIETDVDFPVLEGDNNPVERR